MRWFQQALHTLNDLAKFSEEIKTLSQEFASAQIIIQEATRSIEAFQSKIEFDPKRLEDIELRLAHIATLKKKYGQTIDDILAYKEKIESELHFRENIDYEVEKSEAKLTDTGIAYMLGVNEGYKDAIEELEERNS